MKEKEFNFEVHFIHRTQSGVQFDRLHKSFQGETWEDVQPDINETVVELSKRYSSGEITPRLDKVNEVTPTTVEEPQSEGSDEVFIDDFDPEVIPTIAVDIPDEALEEVKMDAPSPSPSPRTRNKKNKSQ